MKVEVYTKDGLCHRFESMHKDAVLRKLTDDSPTLILEDEVSGKWFMKQDILRVDFEDDE